MRPIAIAALLVAALALQGCLAVAATGAVAGAAIGVTGAVAKAGVKGVGAAGKAVVGKGKKREKPAEAAADEAEPSR